jgi:2-hydroxy-3-keto-5-methylthiopentenyl-1-phosphate phosphatase
MRRPELQLVLDWDGTVTERDTQWMLLEEFGDREVFARVEEELQSGRMTHREVMEVEYATVRVPVEAAAAWLVENARIRAGFHEVVERFDPLILSSGLHELIEPLLAREGVHARVRANRLDPRPDGWRLIWTSDSECAVCGQPCKRGSLPEGDVVYVGDGFSDRCAARAAARVFARDGLAHYLEREGVPYEPFIDFHALAAALS